MKQAIALQIALVLLLVDAAAGLQVQEIWDLTADWSDAVNPNGPWSYNVGTRAIATHVEDWSGSGNPAWAGSVSGRDFDFGWAKAVAGGLGDSLQADCAVGTIIVHSNDPLLGLGSDPTNVTWKSPISGLVRVTGETWFALPAHGAHNGRSNRWRLLHNGTVRANGVVGDDDPFDSSHPAGFEVFASVSVGDLVELEIDRLSVLGTFSAVRLSIERFSSSKVAWDLSEDWSDILNPNGVWAYNAGASQLYNRFLRTQVNNPCWALDTKGVGHIPIWFKRVEGGLGRETVDAPVGTVICHSNDPFNGTDVDTANVTWTSPVAGSIRVQGRTWLCNDDHPLNVGRGNRWRLFHNATILCEGVTVNGDSFDSRNPACFEARADVVPGDLLKLELERVASCGVMSAVCLAVALEEGRIAPGPEPVR